MDHMIHLSPEGIALIVVFSLVWLGLHVPAGRAIASRLSQVAVPVQVDETPND